MNLDKKEKSILFIIKYIPIIFVVILSILTTLIIIYNEQHTYKKQIEKLESVYVETNKKRVKEEVEEIYRLINNTKNELHKLLKNESTYQVYNAYNLIENIYKNNTKLNEEDIIKIIVDALRPVRYNNGRGYFFIYKESGKNLLHPIHPELEGKNIRDYKDKNGTLIFQDLKKQVDKNNEVYTSWYWSKKNKKKQYIKYGFIKKFEPLNIYIGSGDYIDELEADIKEKLLTMIQKKSYGYNGYIFVLDKDGNLLSHVKKDLIGKNVFNDENDKGEKFIKNIIDFCYSNEEGFLSYETPLTYHYQDMKNYKTSFIKLVKEWDWIIGTGFSRDRLYKEINELKEDLEITKNKEIKNIFYISIFITITFIISFIYSSNILKKIFFSYKVNLKKQYNGSLKKEKLLLQQSKVAAMGEMLINISHQWRQPLSTITVMASGMKMKKDLGVLTDKELGEYLNKINSTSQYLSNTIDDFKNFSSPSDKVFKQTSTREIFESTFNFIESELTKHNISVIKTIMNNEFFTIKNELIQCLLTILTNAKDALISIDDKRFIFINSFVKNNKLIIEIYDNAGGIENKILTRIFEPYFTTKHQSQGRGVSLYMTKEILEKHLDSSISVENKKFDYLGEFYVGACFTLKININ